MPVDLAVGDPRTGVPAQRTGASFGRASVHPDKPDTARLGDPRPRCHRSGDVRAKVAPGSSPRADPGMSVPLKTRVLVADDHPIVLRGLLGVLNQQPDFEVTASASDGAEAVTLALSGDVDLAILDISMPRKTGLQAAQEITRRDPRVRVLILSMHENEEYLFEALRAGASGYVLKTGVDRDLVEACRAAMRGEPFLYPGAVRALIREHLDRARRGEPARSDPLTPREQEIVKLIAEAHTNDEIASMLVISKKTVERHRANILEKLGMTDRVELTRYAIRRGLVEP
jgi:DNA-binding NarL/FixJ family response regulator